MSSFVFLNPVALFIFFFLGQAIAQTSVNGQLYTDGLSIVDAPAALRSVTMTCMDYIVATDRYSNH